MTPLPTTVLIVGTGRAAFYLGHALHSAGHVIAGVAGRHPQRTLELAHELGCKPVSLADAWPAADAILIAVSDDAIADVAAAIPLTDAVLMHTSGAGSLVKLAPHPHRAVLWPVMTMGPGPAMDFGSIPVVIDANGARARTLVTALANSISQRVKELTYSDRELVHAAAAISTNFPLFLLYAAQGLLKDKGIDASLLLPSFRAMAQKAEIIGAKEALTGPARRGDIGTVQRHLDRLTHEPELRRAYALLSSMILKTYGHPDHEQHDL